MVAILLIALGSLFSTADTSPEAPKYNVKVEVSASAQGLEIDDALGRTIRLQPGVRTVQLRIRVTSVDEPGTPVDVEDPADIIEIRHPSDDQPPIRLADWRRVSPGVYETTYEFRSAGDYQMLVEPDANESNQDPQANGFTVRVEPFPLAADSTLGTLGLVVAAILILSIGIAVFITTRRRPRTPKPARTHDTWWNSP